MDLGEILSPERVLCGQDLGSKKSVLETLSKTLAADVRAVTGDAVFDCLVARERLGSTGLGKGIALPHARVPHCESARGAFLSTAKAVDFDAVDGKPVDLFFALLVPEDGAEDHLQTLAALAQRFSDDKLLRELRASNDVAEVFNLLTG